MSSKACLTLTNPIMSLTNPSTSAPSSAPVLLCGEKHWWAWAAFMRFASHSHHRVSHPLALAWRVTGGLEHIQTHMAVIPVMSHHCLATPVAVHINLWFSFSRSSQQASRVAVFRDCKCDKATAISKKPLSDLQKLSRQTGLRKKFLWGVRKENKHPKNFKGRFSGRIRSLDGRLTHVCCKEDQQFGVKGWSKRVTWQHDGCLISLGLITERRRDHRNNGWSLCRVTTCKSQPQFQLQSKTHFRLKFVKGQSGSQHQ